MSKIVGAILTTRPPTPMFRYNLRASAVSALFAVTAFSATLLSRVPPPPNMLWSWYADDDFRTNFPLKTGVAWLAMSLNFSRSGVAVVPREAALRTPRGMYEMAVVRFNFEQDYDPSAARLLWQPRQRARAEELILDLVGLTRTKALQIDFDAPESARSFYRELLSSLRKQLPEDTFVSITALVSWCMEPRSWLASLPVDEYVPMVFDMSVPGDAVMTMLKRGGDFPFPGCRASLGIRQGSREVPFKPGVRVYRFGGGKPWSGVAAAH